MKTSAKVLLLFTALLIVIIIESLTEIDVVLLNDFYDFQKREWFITPAEHQQLSFIFYRGSKQFVTLIGTSCVIYMLLSIKIKKYRYNAAAVLVVLLSTMTVSLTVSKLKDVTNIHCPNKLEIYNSKYKYEKFLSRIFEEGSANEKNGRCFPAGHVTGAFSLLSLYLIFRDRRNKIMAFLFSFVLGNITGTYQMMRGEHFISHNVVSMIISLLVILFLKFAVGKALLYIKKKSHADYWKDVDFQYVS
ncbi:MAG: phosphatase PAP2 family protein [Lactobacillaceae bacterium]|jgi:membrane-associated PAP2 superfamily phosphatase|nr:phosphatase PAP2 family protein [Lactobacillaceae bacterium]